MNISRAEKIKLFGKEIVEADEKYWHDLGYKVDYETGLLIKENEMAQNELGEIAMELIADYPLYASTSGITYEEAIAVAKAIFGSDLRAVKAENERVEGLSMEELEAEMKAEGAIK